MLFNSRPTLHSKLQKTETRIKRRSFSFFFTSKVYHIHVCAPRHFLTTYSIPYVSSRKSGISSLIRIW